MNNLNIFYCKKRACLGSIARHWSWFTLYKERAGFASFTYYANLPHTNTTERLPPIILLTCNVISCDLFVAYKYYVTKVEALSCFRHPFGGLGRQIGSRVRQKGVKCWKGSQITNKVSNVEWKWRKSWGLIVFLTLKQIWHLYEELRP